MLDIFERETVGVLGVCGWGLAWVFFFGCFFYGCQSVVICLGWVLALVTRTRHLHKLVRGGDNRRGGRLRPRFFRGKEDGRVPGRPPV